MQVSISCLNYFGGKGSLNKQMKTLFKFMNQLFFFRFFGIPKSILPEIRSSAEDFGNINSGPLEGVPITSVLGDQQAALVGHLCWKKGSAKNT